jgi:hypothetical protein
MTTLTSVVRELLGLFIDDGSLALAILAWVAIVAGLQSAALLPALAGGALVFAGLAAILIENVVRRARRR